MIRMVLLDSKVNRVVHYYPNVDKNIEKNAYA